MDQILVATDLSERSDRAMDRAALLARRFGAKLTIVTVVDGGLPERVIEEQTRSAEGILLEHFDALADGAAIERDLVVKVGRDWLEILGLAEATASGVIILGLHRDRGLADMFRGTTVERVVRQGNRPVLVVKNRASKPYRSVVVGVDFSVHSRKALETAIAVAPGAEVVLVHAFDVPFRGFVSGTSARREIQDQHERQFRAEVEQEMRSLLAGGTGDRVRLKEILRQGDPHEVLAQAVKEADADLLVLGTHGRTGVAHAVLGSVAESFLTDPPCDVLAVPAW